MVNVADLGPLQRERVGCGGISKGTCPLLCPHPSLFPEGEGALHPGEVSANLFFLRGSSLSGWRWLLHFEPLMDDPKQPAFVALESGRKGMKDDAGLFFRLL